MAVIGKEIMQDAARMLGDVDHVRWTLPELCRWVNEGVRAIVLAKPSAKTESRAISLVKGTLQTVPATGTPTPLILVKLTRNLKSDSDPRVGGRAISVTSQATLDATEPNWHEPTVVRQRKEVRQYCFDELNPLEFYVYPGNDGTGMVEAVLGVLPEQLAASGDEDTIDSYAGSVGLPEPYSVPLLDYVLFRAFGKDELEGQPGRSVGHYQLFANAIGLKVQVEGASSPNRRKG